VDLAGTHYDTLCVSRSAPNQVVRAAYMQLAKLYHPDGSSPDEERMKQINEAWHVLSSTSRRALYDAELTLLEHKHRPGADDSSERTTTEPTPSTEREESPLGHQGWGEASTPESTGPDGHGRPGWGEVVDEPEVVARRRPPGPATVRSLHGRALFCSILLAFLAGSAVLATLSLLSRARSYDRLLPEARLEQISSLTDEESMRIAEANGLVSSAVLAAVAVGAITLVAFASWQHRYATNAELLAGRYAFGPNWAVIGWVLLPLCCLVPALSVLIALVQLLSASKATARHGQGAGSGLLVIVSGVTLALAVQYLALGQPVAVGDPSDLDRLVIDGATLDGAAIASRAGADRTTAWWWCLLGTGSLLSLLTIRRLTRGQMAILGDRALFAR
jgi:hypothetical protein